jgi:predicted CXXCH cytochrome family protein
VRLTFGGLALGLLLVSAGTARPADEGCLTCHGDKELRSEKGHSLYVDAAAKRQSAHAGLACGDCHAAISDFPHPAKPARVRCTSCHEEAGTAVAASAHGSFEGQSCASCHGPAHAIKPALALAPGALCESCHEETVRAFRGSIHAAAGRAAGGAECRSCHGPAHGVLGAAAPASRIAKANLPETCGACHANPEFLARHKLPLARPIESYRLSVHGQAVRRGNTKAASCSDCHDSHAILPARDPRSRINHWAVARTCGTCHGEIARIYAASIHGTASERGVRESPVCTDCHGEHAILAPTAAESLVNPARVSTVTCARCHADERLAQKYNLPRDRVPSFEDSFHGLASRSGSQTVANCASCHGIHNILPSSDSRSTVNAANLARTCGQCHPGAGGRFAIGAVHVRAASASEHPVVRSIRLAYVFLIIPGTLGFMLLHNLLDFLAKLIRGTRHGASGRELPRMNLHFRLAHALVVLSFPTLVVTGFALKYPESWWAAPFLVFEGHFALRGLVHRVAAVLLVVSVLYHLVHLIAVPRDRRILQHLLPTWQDAKDVLAMLRHNLGARVQRPTFGVFSYAEKAEYWAILWGTAVMAASGFVLWFNNIALAFLPKWISDAATALHFYEAILATFAILIWHFYMVVFDPDVYPMDRAWITGKASADHLRASRPDYYVRLVEQERRGLDPSSESADDKPRD